MNAKDRRTASRRNRGQILIYLHGRRYTLKEANALAISEYNLGHFQAAAEIYDLMVSRVPRSAQARNNRGVVLQGLKRFDDALTSYDKAIQIDPDYHEAYSNRGVVLQRMERHAEALASCDKAIALKPDYADAHYNRGIALQALARFDDALAGYDRAIALNPGYAAAYGNRGTVLQALKRFDDALASYDKAIALQPDYPEAYYNRAIVLDVLKRFDDALTSCDKAIELKPGYLEAYISRGNIVANKGHMQEAKRTFLQALAIKPDFSEALFELTKLRKYRDANHADVRRIQGLLEKAGSSQRDREYLYFSLGKIYDECGLYDEAFECYRRANEIGNTAVHYDAEGVSATTCRIIDVFSKELLAQSVALGSGSRSPVFIVGMPRSGTSLLASILSNHRLVETAGELPTIVQFAARLRDMVGTGSAYPEVAKDVSPAIASQLTSEYERRLRRDAGSAAAYVVDKHPLNFRHLGLIWTLFPQAHILHCVRDPLDTCLSNYFQRFHLEYDYSFDLRNIAHFYLEYNRLMEHWRQALPKKIIDVVYEDMILRTADVVRQTLDALGLEWDERSLAPHTNPSPVDTASKWQVRQPIYKSSIERWRHYERHLAPLQEMLRFAGQTAELKHKRIG